MKDTPIRYYGSTQPLPRQISLRAGDLTMIYENGFLRYIRQGDTEVVRMIYHAIRDHNWDTMPTRIENEVIETGEDHFSVQYDCICETPSVSFTWKCFIKGNSDSHIQFEISGKALSRFRKNRVGFCVLHPPDTCAGFSCRVDHPDGSFTERIFPENISPHQPFKNIRQMTWAPEGKGRAVLSFEGDIFETEDQRNWTDASYKTYCTPLALPFPVEIQPGDTVFQKVSLSVEKREITTPSLEKKLTVTINRGKPSMPFPELGICRSTLRKSLSVEELLSLRAVGFHHYRVEVRFSDPDWPQQIAAAAGEAHSLGCRLYLAVFFGENAEAELDLLIKEISRFAARIKALAVFSTTAKTTTKKLIREVFTTLRRMFPGIETGVGTNMYFTEVNRERPAMHRPDFLAYSMNPQVHAFDNASLVETLVTQGNTVASAHHISEGKPIFVGPVSFKPRFNPNATASEKTFAEGVLPTRFDPRQFSLFGAGWTLGSIKYLGEAGAKAITYYETVDIYGIMTGTRITNWAKNLGLNEGEMFPVYVLLRHLLGLKNSRIIPTRSSHPLQIEALCISGEGKHLLVIASYSSEIQTVQVENLPAKVWSWCMENDNYDPLQVHTGKPFEEYAEKKELIDKTASFQISPFGLLFIRF